MQILGYEIGFFYARRVQSQPVEVRSTSLTNNPALADLFGYNLDAPAMSVNNDSILGVPPAWSAIRYISEGIASLERGVFRRDRDGDIFPDHVHPVSYLIEGRPHPNYTAFDFLQALISNACLGNGYARIHINPETARPYALELIPSEFVDIIYGKTGEMFYQITGTLNDRSVNITIPSTEMLHIKGVSLTGISGRPIRLVHKGTFSVAQGSQQYSNVYFEKGAAVGGLLTFPLPLEKSQRESVKDSILKGHAGAKNAGSIMVLDSGAQYTPFKDSLKDAAVIDFANLTTIQVSQIFKVPLHLLSQLQRSTFSNMEQQNQDFVIHCLGPWVKKVEEEINTKLFSSLEVRKRSRFMSLDLSALTMGDMQAQGAFFASAIQNGWMTPNEVRAKKNLNKIAGGDQLFIQQNMAPMDVLREILEAKYGEAKTEDAQSEDDSAQPANESQNDATDTND